MDKADIGLLQTLFTENNHLRARNHVLHRELTAKSIQFESHDEELKLLLASRSTQNKSKIPTLKNTSLPIGNVIAPNSPSLPTSKELEDALYTIDRKNNEIRQLKYDIAQLQTDLEAQEHMNDKLEGDILEIQNEFNAYRATRSTGAQANPPVLKEGESVPRRDTSASNKPPGLSAKQVAQLRDKLAESEHVAEQQKVQIQDLITESTRKYSAQQTQLQGLEALLEQVKQQYEEFIQVTKLENDAFKQQQVTEYEQLKTIYEDHKREQYDEKRTMMLEHHAMLFTFQSLFDEYKKTCEFLFNTETAKLQDELTNLSVRYEHELLFTIQAKDKFYSDMMVSKDVKIMNLIEGSDMNLLLQKHESEIDMVRKEHMLEIAKIKSQQETEQNQVVNSLQRQNTSLEMKSEKLTQHIKLLELKLKELMNTVESKNKLITDHEDQRLKLEASYSASMDQERQKYAQVMQEKEYLRHKVIRLNMQRKGTGQSTIEYMLAKISTETTDLTRVCDELTAKLHATTDQRDQLLKQVKSADAWVAHLENEVAKRTDEFKALTTCFGQFIAQKVRRARTHKSGSRMNSGGVDPPEMVVQPVSKQLVKIRVPDIVTRVKANQVDQLRKESHDIDSATQYLKRFQAMSRAFSKPNHRMYSDEESINSTSILGLDPQLQNLDPPTTTSKTLNPIIFDMHGSDSKDLCSITRPTKYKVYDPLGDIEKNHATRNQVLVYKPPNNPSPTKFKTEMSSVDTCSRFIMQPFHAGKVKVTKKWPE